MINPALGVQRLRSVEDIDRIAFINDMAVVEAPAELLDLLPFKNDRRLQSERLSRVIRSIRANGYNSAQPIVVRLGRRGRWVIYDGGHRLTAARRVSHEIFTNAFGRKVRTVSFLVFRTPLSLSKVKPSDRPRKKRA
ncbi:MAG: ParB/RepB/Spo0J family partition protein [Caulobacterales bacterium]|nr:ParB/RepB/Spo0J family partition protein [Caulobacterales bacterium]